MRFNLFLLALVCLCGVSAEAKNGYFGARTGITEVQETEIVDGHSTAAFGSAYVGAYTSVARVEGEYSFLGKARYDSLNASARFQRVMANGYFDIYATRYVRPYLGVGLGATFYAVEKKHSEEKESGGNFTWSAGGGVGIRLTRNITFDSGYRFVNMGDVELDDKTMHFNAHEFYSGLRFLF